MTDRSFRYASPCLWNQFPVLLRQPHPSLSISPLPALVTLSFSLDYGHPAKQMRTLYVCPVSFFLLFSSPNLSGRRLDVYHTCLSANLERRSEMFCTRPLEMQDPKIAKNSPYWHYGEILSGCIFATKARIDNRKKKC